MKSFWLVLPFLAATGSASGFKAAPEAARPALAASLPVLSPAIIKVEAAAAPAPAAVAQTPVTALSQVQGAAQTAAVAPDSAQLWDNVHLEGKAEVAALEALNEEIVSGKIGLAELKARGLVKDGSASVMRQGNGADQPMPFREILLTAAHAGGYFPTKLGPAAEYQGLLIFIPGIGSEISNAKSVLDVALTFSKAKKDPVLDDVNGKRLRMITFALDATLNGLQQDAPPAFGSPEGSVAVVRHAALVLKLMYPGKPVFVAGRSQGGLIALEVAARHDDVAGVMALAPSHTNPEVIAETVRQHDDPNNTILDGARITVHGKSWEAYKTQTARFTALESPSRAPALVMVSHQDPSYPQPAYVESMQAFASRDAKRRAVVVEAPADRGHNLWNRWDEQLYRRVIGEMARFFQSHLPK